MAVEGRSTVESVDNGTDVTAGRGGLAPTQLYSIWVTGYESPGFVDTRDLGDATRNRV